MHRSAIPLVLIAVAVTYQGARAETACQSEVFESDHFTVCVADTSHQEIRLALADASGAPMRGFDRLAAFLGTAHVRFAMNAGMFDGQGSPIGLYVENSTERVPLNTKNGSGNFYLKPNGVFWLDDTGGAHIETSEGFAQRHPSPRWATQSGPMLVVSGELNPQIAPDGASKYVRNGVGIRDAHTAIFAISDEPVSFGRFARLFRDDQHCTDALYLDGAVSSLWAPSLGRKDAAHPLGPLVVVTDR